MSAVEQLAAQIGKLTLEERAELMRLLNRWEDDDWDRQIAEDAAAGKLDQLIADAKADAVAGRLRDLP